MEGKSKNTRLRLKMTSQNTFNSEHCVFGICTYNITKILSRNY